MWFPSKSSNLLMVPGGEVPRGCLLCPPSPSPVAQRAPPLFSIAFRNGVVNLEAILALGWPVALFLC